MYKIAWVAKQYACLGRKGIGAKIIFTLVQVEHKIAVLLYSSLMSDYNDL